MYRSDNYFKAVKYFDTLIKLSPSEGEFYFKRGYSYDQIYKRQMFRPAIDDYLKSIELGYNVQQSYSNLGLSYVFKNDSIAAVYFEKSLKLKPDNPDISNLLRYCRTRLKKDNRLRRDLPNNE